MDSLSLMSYWQISQFYLELQKQAYLAQYHNYLRTYCINPIMHFDTSTLHTFSQIPHEQVTQFSEELAETMSKFKKEYIFPKELESEKKNKNIGSMNTLGAFKVHLKQVDKNVQLSGSSYSNEVLTVENKAYLENDDYSSGNNSDNLDNYFTTKASPKANNINNKSTTALESNKTLKSIKSLPCRLSGFGLDGVDEAFMSNFQDSAITESASKNDFTIDSGKLNNMYFFNCGNQKINYRTLEYSECEHAKVDNTVEIEEENENNFNILLDAVRRIKEHIQSLSKPLLSEISNEKKNQSGSFCSNCLKSLANSREYCIQCNSCETWQHVKCEKKRENLRIEDQRKGNIYFCNRFKNFTSTLKKKDVKNKNLCSNSTNVSSATQQTNYSKVVKDKDKNKQKRSKFTIEEFSLLKKKRKKSSDILDYSELKIDYEHKPKISNKSKKVFTYWDSVYTPTTDSRFLATEFQNILKSKELPNYDFKQNSSKCLRRKGMQ